MGSTFINIGTNNGFKIQELHHILNYSSQWVFGRNERIKSSIMQLYNAGMIDPENDTARINLPIGE